MSDQTPPELPRDPGPEITRIMDSLKPKTDLEQQTADILKALPEETRTTLTRFFADLAKNVFTQLTQPDGTIKINPDSQRFYEERLREVNESGFLNPHQLPRKNIT